MSNPIQDVQKYVRAHTTRLALDTAPDVRAQFAKVVDMDFFAVGVDNKIDVAEITRLTEAAYEGYYSNMNPIEEGGDITSIGGWIGDQGLAMEYMAMAEAAGLGTNVTNANIGAIKDPTKKLFARMHDTMPVFVPALEPGRH